MNSGDRDYAFDWLIITASNSTQAAGYQLQLDARKSLPGVRNTLIVPDPHDARAGSGGSTFAALYQLAERVGTDSRASLHDILKGLRVLILHSGGDAQRLPEYSPSGKIFVPYHDPPLDAVLPGHSIPTTLFDCILHDFVRCASPSPCVMIGAGDLYLDLATHAAARIAAGLPLGVVGVSASASPERGTRHGVYVTDSSDRVETFLQKPTLEQLRSHGAVRSDGTVAIDTGALFIDWETIAHWMSAAGLTNESAVTTNSLLQLVLDAQAGSIDLYEHILPLLARRSVTKPVSADLEARLKRVVAGTPFHAMHAPKSEFLHIGTTRELLQVNFETPAASSVSIRSFAARGPAFLENILAPDAAIEASGNNVLIGMPAQATAGRSLPVDRCMSYFPTGDAEWSLLWHPLNLDFKTVPMDPLATLRELLCAPKLPIDSLAALQIDPARSPFHWPLWPIGSLEQVETAYLETTAASSISTLSACRRVSCAQLHKHVNLARILQQQQYAVVERSKAIPALTPLPRLPSPTPRSFNTITVTCPARIDLAGGWTDTPPVCLMQGGHVVNMAINLDSIHPVRITLRRTPRPGLTISSLDQQSQRSFALDQPLALPPAHDWCSLAQAAALLTICENAPHLPLERQEILQSRGLHIEFESRVPRGSGLGTSSILAGALIAAFRTAQGYEWSRAELHQVCTRVLRAEQLIGAGGGWQDQYGGLSPGVKDLRTEPRDPFQAPVLTPFDLGRALRELFETRALFYYTGQQRLASNILSRFVSRYLSADPDIRAVCEEIAATAESVAQAIRADAPIDFINRVTRYWILKKQIDSSASNPALESIIQSVHSELQGYLLPGAGGGGFLLFFASSTAAKQNIIDRLTSNPPNSEAKFFDLEIDESGPQITIEP